MSAPCHQDVPFLLAELSGTTALLGPAGSRLGCCNSSVSLLAYGKRLDDEYLARRAAGRPVVTRDGVALLCLAAAVPSAVIPCASLLAFSGVNDSGTWLLTLVVGAALALTTSAVWWRGGHLLALLGAAVMWAVSAAGLQVTYVFLPAAAFLTTAALLRSARRRTR